MSLRSTISTSLLPPPFHCFAARVIILSCRFHNILRSRRFLRSTPSSRRPHPPLPGHQRRHSRSIKVMKTPRTFQPSRVTLRAPKGFPSKEFIPRRGLLNSKQTTTPLFSFSVASRLLRLIHRRIVVVVVVVFLVLVERRTTLSFRLLCISGIKSR